MTLSIHLGINRKKYIKLYETKGHQNQNTKITESLALKN